MSSEVTVLLMLEAIDRASGIIEGITGGLDELGVKAQEAADKAAMTGDELQSALVKAEAATNAYNLAADEQTAAQDRLAASTQAVRDAQGALADAESRTLPIQDALGESGMALVASYQEAAAAAAESASAQEASGQAIADLQAKLAAVHGAAADSVQAALAREQASYTELAAAAQTTAAEATRAQETLAAAAGTSADEVAAAFDRQVAASQAASAALGEQVVALDALTKADSAAAARSAEMASAQDAANTKIDMSGAAMKGAAATAAITAAAVAGIGYESVKAAGDFQSLTEHLVTDAGETQSNLASVQAGILRIAGATGTSTTDLVNGMYHIESAGYHGAAGLTMLQTAAEGAKVGGADLDTVSKALVGTMNAYGASAGQSTSYMNQLIATVGAGDMRMQDLASSMSSVTASAAAAHIQFAQVGGAIATMTAQGMSANQATQDLSHTIGAMSNPNSVQIKEMQAMGLSSNQVASDLGKQGLTGTFQELTAAVAKHISGGQVLISTFQASQQAAANANVMIKAMPGSLQKLADAYLSGSVTQLQWTNDLKAMPPIQAKMMGQFATLADKTHAFNSELTSGSPAAQTYNAAMSKLMGGTVGLNTALMLTGTHAATFSQNVATVAKAAGTGGDAVANWASIQGTMNQKLDQLKASVQAAAIGLGTALIPMLTKILDVVMKIVTPIADWIDHNQKLAAVILLVVGGLATLITVMVAVAKVVKTVGESWTILGRALGLIPAAAETAGAATAAGGDEIAAAGEAADIAWGPWLLAIAAIGIAAYEIVKHWSTVKQWMVDFWDWIKKVFDDVVGFVKDHVHEIAAGLTLLLGPIGLVIAAVLEIATHWRQVEAVLKDVWNWMKGAAKDVSDVVSGAFETVVKFVSGLWHGFVNDLKIDWGLLVGAWNATGGRLVTNIAHAWDQVSAAFDKEWSKITGDLSSIWGSIKQIWDATGGALIAAIEQATSDVVSFLSAHWSQIKTVIEDALRPVVAIVRADWDLVRAVFAVAIGDIRAITVFGWGLISGAFKAAWDLMRGIVQVGWDIITGIFRVAWDLITSSVRAGWDIISGIFQATGDVIVGVVKIIWAMVTSIINVALDVLKGTFQFFADLLTGKWGKLWGDIKSTFSSVWNDMTGYFKSVLGDIESTVSGAVSSIWRGFIGAIESALSGIGKALDDVWHAVIHAFDDAGTWLLQAGEDIVNGLIKGVENMAGQAVQAVKNVGSDLIKGAKSVLSIFSPSKEFASIGEQTMAGMVQGIAGAAPTVNAAMRNAMKGLSGPSLTASVVANAHATGTQLGVAVASGLGGAASGGGIGGGTSVVQNFTGNYLMNDSDMTKFAQMVGKQVVGTIGPQGGVKTLMR